MPDITAQSQAASSQAAGTTRVEYGARHGVAHEVTGKGSINPYLTGVLTSVLEPLADLGVIPLPIDPGTGLDLRFWRPILSVPTPDQPRITDGNYLGSTVGSGDRRIVSGTNKAHMEAGNYLDMSVAANMHLAVPITPQVTYPFTIACVFRSPIVGAQQVPMSVFSSVLLGSYHAVGLNSSGNLELIRGVDGGTTVTIATGLSYQANTWHLMACTFTSDTEATVYLDVRSSTKNHAAISANNIDRYAVGKWRSDSLSDFTGQLSASLCFNGALTDDEHFNLYETLMKNKGGPMVIPQVANLKRFFPLSERSGKVCFDIANPLESQTAAEIQNYVSTVRKASASVPKQMLNDQSCSEAWLYDGSSAHMLPPPPQIGVYEIDFVYTGTDPSGAGYAVTVEGSASLGIGGNSSTRGMMYWIGDDTFKVVGITMEVGTLYRARITYTATDFVIDVDDGSGFVEYINATYTGGIPTLGMTAGAGNIDGTTTIFCTQNILRVNLGTYDTKVDGFGTPVGNPDLILLPNNQVELQVGQQLAYQYSQGPTSGGNYHDTGIAPPNEGAFEIHFRPSGETSPIGRHGVVGSSWEVAISGAKNGVLNVNVPGDSQGYNIPASDSMKIRLEWGGPTWETFYDQGAGWVGLGARAQPAYPPLTAALVIGARGIPGPGVDNFSDDRVDRVIIYGPNNATVVYDTERDGWGTPGFEADQTVNPSPVYVAGGTPTDVDIAGNTPDFSGSAPRDILLEQSSAFLSDKASDRNATFTLGSDTLDGASYAKISVLASRADSAVDYVVSCPNAASNNGFDVRMSNSTLHANLNATGGIVTAVATGDYSNTLIEAEYDNGALTLRSNGIVIATASTSGTIMGARGELSLGTLEGGSGINTTATIQDVKLYVGDSTNLVRHIKCSEGNGNTLYDSVTGQAATISNPAASQWTTMQGGSALNASDGFSFARQFDGTATRVACGTYFSGKNDFYVSLMLSRTVPGSALGILSEFGGGRPMQIRMYSNGRISLGLNAEVFQLLTIGFYENGDVTKVEAFRVGSIVTLSINNGEEVVTGTYADTLADSSGGDVLIGTLTTYQFFSGVVRDVKLGASETNIDRRYKLDESFRETVAIDSSGTSDGTYVGFTQTEADIVRIPAKDATTDAWGLTLSNHGINNRNDGVTHNDSENTENWGGRAWDKTQSLAPYTTEFSGETILDGTSLVTLDAAKLQSPGVNKLTFECSVSSGVSAGAVQYLLRMSPVALDIFLDDSTGQFGITSGATVAFGPYLTDSVHHAYKVEIEGTVARGFIDGTQVGSDQTITAIDVSALTSATLFSGLTGGARNARLLYDGVEMLRIPFVGPHAIDYAQDAIESETNMVYPINTAPVARVYNEDVGNPGFVKKLPETTKQWSTPRPQTK